MEMADVVNEMDAFISSVLPIDIGIGNILNTEDNDIIIDGGKVTKMRGGAKVEVTPVQILTFVIVVCSAVALYYTSKFYDQHCQPDQTFLFGPFLTITRELTQNTHINKACNLLNKLQGGILPTTIAVVNMVVLAIVRYAVNGTEPSDNAKKALVEQIKQHLQESTSVTDLLRNMPTDGATNMVADQITAAIITTILAKTDKPVNMQSESIQDAIKQAVEAAVEDVASAAENTRKLRSRCNKGTGPSKQPGSDEGPSGLYQGGAPRASVFVLGRKRVIVRKSGDRKQYVTVNKKLVPLADARAMEKAKKDKKKL